MSTRPVLTTPVLDQITAEPVGSFLPFTVDDVDLVVEWEGGALLAWSTAANDRATCLLRWAEALEADADRVPELIGGEGGKSGPWRPGRYSCPPIHCATTPGRPGDVRGGRGPRRRVVGLRRAHSGRCRGVHGPVELVRSTAVPRSWAHTRLGGRPRWSSPCPTGCRPSSISLRSIIRRGCLNVLSQCCAGGADLGTRVVSHPTERAVAFTGSVETGRDADRGRRAHSGAARVRRSAQFEVLDTLDTVVTHARSLIVGNPGDPGTCLGPLITTEHRGRVVSYIGLVRREARLVDGESTSLGWPYPYLDPAVVIDARPDSPPLQHEIFGPVVKMDSADDEARSVWLATVSPLCFTARVWTANGDCAWRVGRRIQAGTAWIIQFGGMSADVRFGGMNASGLDRTCGHEGQHQLTDVGVLNRKPVRS